MDLLSTTLGGSKSVGTLDMAALHALCKPATRITVVSAFYDCKFLDDVVAGIAPSRRRLVHVDVILHGFTGARLRADLEALRAWRSRQALKNVNVSLINKGVLFHSKLLVFEGKDSAAVLVGSANATSAAYGENEEIMLSMAGERVHVAVRDYVARLSSEARSIDDVDEPEVRTLIAFFRTGDVFYKPNALPLFRFDLRLPEKLREKLSTLTENIPGFSAKTSRTYNPFAGMIDEEVDDGAASRISIRPYAVQTCFGWWAPRQYHRTIDDAVDKASSKKRERLQAVQRLFTERVESGAVLTQAERSFELLVKVANDHMTPLEENEKARLERFEQFLARCRTQLTNKRWFDRATRAYDHAPMPEIWADPIAREEFEESFFDYLQYANSASTMPLILTSLRRSIGIEPADGAIEICAKLKDHLREFGWTGAEWLKGDLETS